MSRLYVYALVDEPRRSMQIGGRRIEFVAVGDIQAAVERRSAAPKLSEAGLRRQHRIVVQLARWSRAILPVRFGAWIDEQDLIGTVEVHRRTLRRALNSVRDQEQMTVRIFASREPMSTERQSSSGTAYLQDRRGGPNAALRPTLQRVRRAVARMVSRESIDNGEGRTFASVHHLIERGRSREYKTLVMQACSTLETGQNIVVSGPWPPFAFVPDIWS